MHRAYLLLCLLRAALILSPGYIHPDEFFQGPEVFRVPACNRTWEWQPQNALRSPVVPFVFAHLASRWLPGAWWWSARLVPLLASFGVDLFVYRAAGTAKLLLFASSWPALLLMSRSFSNGVEAVAVAGIALARPHAVWVGCIGAAGLFARFTFPAFAVAFVRLPPRWKTIAAAVVVSAVIVAIDSRFYGRWVVTPVQSLLYNSKTDNVAAHGLHPRGLHALVNLPLLLGPILVLRLRPSLSWMLPLAILSLSPHQEPRFLLPLVAPAIIATKDGPVSRLEWTLHVAFHASVTGFFGFLHQAGVVPSLAGMASDTRHAVFWKTYPPPLHVKRHANIVDMQGRGDFHAVLESVRDTLVAPAHVVPEHDALELMQCWGPHISTEHFSPEPRNWQLCQWRKRVQ